MIFWNSVCLLERKTLSNNMGYKMFLKDLICNLYKDLALMFHAVIDHLNIVISNAAEWCTESTNLSAIAYYYVII